MKSGLTSWGRTHKDVETSDVYDDDGLDGLGWLR